MDLVSSTQCFGGSHQRYTHYSDTLNTQMQFAVYLPPQYQNQATPLLYWLSGLTCTDENFMQKAGALKLASELGLAIIAPDTSPRGDNVPDDPQNAYDFGIGAGFYLNALKEPWRENYQMYDYILKELPSIVENNFKFIGKPALSGHSMGGHGALVLALRNPQNFGSVSAFSPICHPTIVPWGKKAFSNYLGDDETLWAKYDSVILMKNLSTVGAMPEILIDQGDNDQFLEVQLKPELLEKAAKQVNYPLTLRYQKGYDHSYYFISTFINDHLMFHHNRFEMNF
ncbi:S-formylglutathione hydrolase [Thiotrichales bacterium 19S3-7]|nr:S-formylglutathione hydrolase [Thiotrichales bacterium 19S3-7]MCF6802322.1 S-formylglutathione hydrolase [Thiotrichales bacterium 19S3-11]